MMYSGKTILILLLSLAFRGALSPNPVPCPIGSIMLDGFEGRCFGAFQGLRNWPSVSTICYNNGGYPAYIDSQELGATLKNTLSAGSTLMIGLHDTTNEGTFTWVDGTFPEEYFWAAGQPDDMGCPGEDLVEVRESGLWYDARALSQAANIACEFDAEPTSSPSTPPTIAPSTSPSVDPTVVPSTEPTTSPSTGPSFDPQKSDQIDACEMPEGYENRCINCNVKNCIMTCDNCGFGKTSIDLASRCPGGQLEVIGGALVCPSHDDFLDASDAAIIYGDIGDMLALQGKCVDEWVLKDDIMSANCLTKSRKIFEPTSESTESVFNGLIWSFGQFVDHDLDLIKETKVEVHVPVTNDTSFEFPLSKSSCDDGKFGKRVNEITSILDLSSVYNESCPLKYDPVSPARLLVNDGLLPKCAINNEMGLPCAQGQFICGDERCNENPFLMAQHHIWAFHHNYIVDEIENLPIMKEATDQEVYHAAKHINIVTYQKIIYDEFLPALVGQLTPEEVKHSNFIHSDPKTVLPGYRCKVGSWLDLERKKITSELCIEILHSLEECSDTYMSYSINKGCFCVPKESTCSYKIRESQVETYEIAARAKTDVSMSPLFAGAAYRLHHLVNDEFELADGTVDLLKNHFFNPLSFVDNGKTDHFVLQLLKQKAHRFGAHMSFSLQHALFGSGDLAARNCMRGRDLDLPTYNEARKLMGLPAREDFDFSWSTCGELAEIYDNDVHAIELFIGGSCESPVPGAVLGETFRAIVKDQFLRLRDGDPNYNAPHLFGHKYRTFAEVLGEVTGVDLSNLDFDNVFMYQEPSV